MKTIEYQPGNVRLLDQTLLPHREEAVDCRNIPTLIEAIRALRVRGAPAIGVSAAYGVAMAVYEAAEPVATAREAIADLREARPTAVNLGWALDRMRARLEGADEGMSASRLHDWLLVEARNIHEEDEELCRRLGEHGASLLPDPATVITHCNTGALATGGMGTALAALVTAHQQGKRVHVYADETRPLLQGARLTTWELQRSGVEVTLIPDSAAAWVMRTRRIDAVMLGADRIAANGDTANKIGTYSLAVNAARHGVPFYVVAPYSTLDLSLASGEQIPIESRDGEEVRRFGDSRVAPPDVDAFNPAFDVTPAELVTAIVTERGIFRAPFETAFRGQYEDAASS